MQVYRCKRSKKVASQLSNYPRTKGCIWEKLDLSMKNEIFPIGFGNDLKYEEKGFKKLVQEVLRPDIYPRGHRGYVAGRGRVGRWLLRVFCFLPFSLFLTPFLSSPAKLLPALPSFLVLCLFFPFAHVQLLTHKRLCWFCVHTGWYDCIPLSLPVYPRLCP